MQLLYSPPIAAKHLLLKCEQKQGRIVGHDASCWPHKRWLWTTLFVRNRIHCEATLLCCISQSAATQICRYGQTRSAEILFRRHYLNHIDRMNKTKTGQKSWSSCSRVSSLNFYSRSKLLVHDISQQSFIFLYLDPIQSTLSCFTVFISATLVWSSCEDVGAINWVEKVRFPEHHLTLYSWSKYRQKILFHSLL